MSVWDFLGVSEGGLGGGLRWDACKGGTGGMIDQTHGGN